MHRTIIRTWIGVAASLLSIRVAMAEEQKESVVLAVMGSPIPQTVFGDARHCPVTVAPVAKPAGDRIEYSLPAREPVSITLTTARGGEVCGGSLYVLPEPGLGYAARLTPGGRCAAEFFRINPLAKPAVQLIKTDNHPELNELLCATQQGASETSRLTIGPNAQYDKARIEIDRGGDCDNFSHISPSNSGIELVSGTPRWIRTKFRVPQTDALYVCDVSIKFTPEAGAAYLIEAGDNKDRCEVQLFKADVAGTLLTVRLEGKGDANCKPTK
jgi:hypothetical protein